MLAIDVYRNAHDAGLTIRADADKLLVGPAERVTEELRLMLHDNKPELLEFLERAHATTVALLQAAERACDHHGDASAARQEMRDQCLNTPLHQRADMLDHFQQTYHGVKP